MGIQDSTLKTLWFHTPELFFPLLGLEGAAVVGHLPTEVVSKQPEPTRAGDKALKLSWKGQELIAHGEFEADPKGSKLPYRLAEYGARMHFQYKLPVRSVLFLLSSPGKMERFYSFEVGGTRLHYTFEVVAFYEHSAARMAEDPVLAPLCLLGKRPSQKLISKALATIEKSSPSEKYKAGAVAALYLLATMFYDLDEVKAMFADLKEVIRTNPGARDLYEEGRAEQAAEMVLVILANKFTNYNNELEDMLARCTLEDLDWLLREVLHAKSLKALQTALEARLQGR